MKRLSNTELRILYLRRQFLTEFIQVAAVQMQANLGDSWKRTQQRINQVRAEIKGIVEDPQFDLLVSEATVSHPREHTYSSGGTMLNSIATARELLTYVNGLLSIHINPKSEELKQDPKVAARVFIGHGRADIVRLKVKDFIRECRLEPLVLQDLPSDGATVIEKLEKYGRTADYAVLILTGDDIVGDKARARQNVLQELGWFQGVLGRDRTAMLVQRGVEIASNLSGIVYLDFDGDNVEATLVRLRQEFVSAGLLT